MFFYGIPFLPAQYLVQPQEIHRVYYMARCFTMEYLSFLRNIWCNPKKYIECITWPGVLLWNTCPSCAISGATPRNTLSLLHGQVFYNVLLLLVFYYKPAFLRNIWCNPKKYIELITWPGVILWNTCPTCAISGATPRNTLSLLHGQVFYYGMPVLPAQYLVQPQEIH